MNAAIRIYNNYVLQRADLDSAIESVEYDEGRLKDETRKYMEDIKTIKSNVDKFELNRNEND